MSAAPGTMYIPAHMPHFVSCTSVVRSSTGKSWRVTLWSATDPRSNMPALVRRYWIKVDNPLHAYNEACGKASNSMQTYLRGTRICWDFRERVCKSECKRIAVQMRGTYGNGYLYKNRTAQDAMQKVLDRKWIDPRVDCQ